MVAVLVDSVVIEDGQVPPPEVGARARYRLVFHEADGVEPDATVSTWRARAEPRGARRPVQVLGWDGTPDGPPQWPIVLYGRGWSACWAPTRNVTGELTLRGTLVADFEVMSDVGVSGRITRARVVTETVDTSSENQDDWQPIPERQQLREVDTSPRWFDHGLTTPPGAPSTGWSPLVPAHPYVCEVGVLVELTDIGRLPSGT